MAAMSYLFSRLESASGTLRQFTRKCRRDGARAGVVRRSGCNSLSFPVEERDSRMISPGAFWLETGPAFDKRGAQLQQHDVFPCGVAGSTEADARAVGQLSGLAGGCI